MQAELPRPLRPAVGARLLNILGVAVALAALASVLVHKSMRETEPPLDALYAASAPAFIFAAIWAALLRLGGGLEGAGLWTRIVASAFGLISAVLFLWFWAQSILFIGVQAAAIPIFLAGLVVMAWAHHRATASTIASDEQRESGVARAAMAVAAVALALLLVLPEEACAWGNGVEAIGVVCTPHGTDARNSFGAFPLLVPELAREDRIAFIAALVLSVVAFFVSAAAWNLARRREGARHTFLREVEAGTIEGFRVRVRDEHRTLVRVAPHAEGYRNADFETPILEYRRGSSP